MKQPHGWVNVLGEPVIPTETVKIGKIMSHSTVLNIQLFKKHEKADKDGIRLS